MSDEELQTIWRQSIDHYGKQLQSIVCMEEYAELIQAISKKLRKDTSSNDVLAEEMADVIVCLHQLKMMYGITDKAISDWVEANGFEQTSCECGGVMLGPKTVRVITECSCCGDPDCDCPCCEEDDDTHHVFTLRCNAHDCYNTIDVGEDDWGYYPERKEDAIRYAVECEGWAEGKHGIQVGHLYCPEHAKDVWEES